MATKTLLATDENMDAVHEFVHAQLGDGCPLQLLNQIDLAVEEIYINIAHYAYAPTTDKVEITCTVEGAPPAVTVTFKDRGRRFDPLAREVPDLTLSAEDRQIGGLGIYLTRQFMDEVSYCYEDGQNVLSFRKTLTL